MSEHTLCNYCTLRRIKEHAKQKGQSVTLVSRQLGVEVYRHPKGVNVRQLSNRRRANRSLRLLVACCINFEST
jgi:hypothetical protein